MNENEITIKTQAEFDALPAKFDTYTRIDIKNDGSLSCIYVSAARENARVVARWSARVVVQGNASVEAWENASVLARGNALVLACERAEVEVSENASVIAREQASVVVYGNASVVAWGNVGVYLQSDRASVVLFAYAVCWLLRLSKESQVQKKSENATIIKPKPVADVDGWLEEQCIEQEENGVVLFLRVSSDFKTQENTPNETLWALDSTVEHKNWKPDDYECGPGTFWACSRPYDCDEFRSNEGDRYIAVKVAVKDLSVWLKNPSYPRKIDFRKGTVLYECDWLGKKKA